MEQIPVLAMIIRSGWFARVILILLVLLSVIAWSVILNRLLYLSKIRKLNRLFRKKYDKTPSLLDLEKADPATQKSLLAAIGGAGAIEYRRILSDAQSYTNGKDWSFFFDNQFSIVKDRLDSLTSELASNLDKWTYILAVTSSSAPFLGLLGTVWGIMDAFFAIGDQGSASLPTVAPGIAEALITTAISLIVAIPAAIFHNVIQNSAQRAEDEMFEFKDTVVARLRREIMARLFGNRTTPPAA